MQWGGAGGGRHLRKRSLLNGNQMGCILLNRIPGLQLWAGAWPGVLSPWPLVCAEGTWRRGQGVEGGRPRGCDGAASRPQAAGRGSVFLSLCHAVSQPFARISKLEAYQEAILSFLSFLVFFFLFLSLCSIILKVPGSSPCSKIPLLAPTPPEYALTHLR